VGYDPRGLSYKAFNLPSHPDHKYIWFRVGISVTFFKTDFPAGWGRAPITLLFRASFFFIEKVHILRITHFSETTKDRNLIFGMGGDANVKIG
jgi:hypothetical protein